MKSKLGYFLKLKKALCVLSENRGGVYRSTSKTPPFHHRTATHRLINSLYYQLVI
jgi:hypothetical protein